METFLGVLGLLLLAAALVWGGVVLLDHLFPNRCTAPYHLVYAGTKPELVGKVVVPVNQYYCEHN